MLTLSGVTELHCLSFAFEQGMSIADLANLINTARIPTAQRVSTLESDNETLRTQLAEAARRKPARSGGAAVEPEEEEDDGHKAEAAERQREQEELKAAPNPISEYVEMLEEKVYLILLLLIFTEHDATDSPCNLPVWH